MANCREFDGVCLVVDERIKKIFSGMGRDLKFKIIDFFCNLVQKINAPQMFMN